MFMSITDHGRHVQAIGNRKQNGKSQCQSGENKTLSVISQTST